MKVWIDESIPAYKVGDLVFYNLSKNDTVYRIAKIERRFLTDQDDVDRHQNIWPGCEIGDEYNPIIAIEAVMDLSIRADAKKKVRKSSRWLDAFWLSPITPQQIQTQIQRLNDLLVQIT